MMEDNVAIRLKGFIDSQGLSNSQFADTCGIPRPSLSQLLSGRNKKISDVLVGQIHQAYPDLSVLWLMFGEGPMLLKNAETPTHEAPNIGQNGMEQGNDRKSANFNGENLTPDRDESENSNLRGLTRGGERTQPSYNKQFDEEIKNIELIRQIEKLKKNPRRVSHITIYYDDSTFETFYPRR